MAPRGTARRTTARVLLLLCGAALGGSAARAPAAPDPAPARCAGAASRDPERPCRNPALRTTVVPTPEDALLVSDAPCVVEHEDGLVDACAFGAAAARATRTVALLGDSHATHWRAALAGAAARRHWRGLSLTKSSCPFTLAVPRTASRADCAAWNQDVLRALRAHPEVHVVFVSAHTGARIVPAGGRNALATKVAGHLAAWRALPPSVRRIVVLRDVPAHPAATADCVQRAAARHEDAGRRCAVPRRTLMPDAEAIAARRLPRSRVSVVDVTPVLCGPASCPPVIGGVLVNKDTDHLTRAFAATLAPFVLRVTDRALAG